MAIGAIGQNSVEEFFEEIVYQVGYSEARTQIKDFTKDVHSEIVKEALESAMNVLVMGLMMIFIRQQEQFIQKVFTLASELVVLALASNYAQKVKSKLQNLKGFKFLKKFDMFQKSYSDRVATAQLVVNGANMHINAEKNTHSEGSTIDTVINQKEHIINKERLHIDLADKMSSRYTDSLMFKVMTKSFTANDTAMIKKILGRDTGSQLDIDDLNKVADFMYVKDSAGKVTGLSEQFLTMLNGLGYIHNKI